MKFSPVVCGRPTRRLWSQHAVIMLREGRSGGPSIIFPIMSICRVAIMLRTQGKSRTFVALCRCGAVVHGLWSLIFGGCVGCYDEETPQVCRVAISLATRSLLPTGGGSSEWHERVGTCCRRLGY
jgi:hypothetical protein